MQWGILESLSIPAQSLWRPPQLRSSDPDGHRASTWTELFFDLIFVVCISELTHALLGQPDWTGVLRYFALFVPVWWSWAGGTFYSDRFDADDISHRLIVALQMLFVAAMASTIHAAWTSQAAGFAICYALVRSTVIFNYLRVGWHHPHTRRFVNSYAAGFAVAAAMWLASIWIPAPWRFWWLGLAMLVDLGTPVMARSFNASFPLHRSHLPERFGLFTILVLGESVVSVVAGYAQGEPGLLRALVAAMGFAGIFAFWWIYFNSIEGTGLNQGYRERITWIYSHLPLLAALAAVAVGVRMAVAGADSIMAAPVRWLLCSALAVAYGMLGVQHLNAMGQTCPKLLLRKGLLRFATAGGVLTIAAFAEQTPTPVVALLLMLLGAFNVIYDLALQAIWLRELAGIKREAELKEETAVQGMQLDGGLDLDPV